MMMMRTPPQTPTQTLKKKKTQTQTQTPMRQKTYVTTVKTGIAKTVVVMTHREVADVVVEVVEVAGVAGVAETTLAAATLEQQG
jgi:hypothetical protein